jgi:hypothetical protein
MSRLCSLAADQLLICRSLKKKMLICPSSFVASSFFITGLPLALACCHACR